MLINLDLAENYSQNMSWIEAHVYEDVNMRVYTTHKLCVRTGQTDICKLSWLKENTNYRVEIKEKWIDRMMPGSR